MKTPGPLSPENPSKQQELARFQKPLLLFKITSQISLVSVPVMILLFEIPSQSLLLFLAYGLAVQLFLRPKMFLPVILGFAATFFFGSEQLSLADRSLRTAPFAYSFLALLIFSTGSNPLLKFSPPFLTKANWFKRGAPWARGVWVFGLGLNTLILSLFLFKGSQRNWALFTGFQSYLLMLATFLLSFLILFRFQVQDWQKEAKEQNVSFLKIILWKADHIRRISAYLWGFFLFGSMCLLTLPLAVPLAVLPGGFRRLLRPVTLWTVHHVFRFVRWHCRHFYFVDMRLHKIGCQPHTHFFVCNHISMFDVVLLFSFFPGMRSLVKTTFSRNPFLWAMVRLCGHPPVEAAGSFREPSVSSLFTSDSEQHHRIAAPEETLQRGEPFCLFPEGTRGVEARLQKLRMGAFLLAVETGVPITPVFFRSSQAFLNKGVFFPKRPGRVRLDAFVLNPIPLPKPSESLQTENSQWKRAQLLRETFVKAHDDFFSSRSLSSIALGTHPDFEGHFPGFPILPAVSQVGLVIDKIESDLRHKIEFCGIRKAKFKAMIQPGQNVTLDLDPSTLSESQTHLQKWKLSSEDLVFSEGVLEFRIPSLT